MKRIHLFILSVLLPSISLAQTPTAPIVVSNNIKLSNPVQGSLSDSIVVWRGSGDKILRWIKTSDLLSEAGTGTVTSVTGNTASGITVANGSTAPYIDIQQASSTQRGTAKLYTTTGANTDGGVDQNTYTTGLAGKQDVLVSGSTIKTVGGQSLLGSGNVTEVQNSLTASTTLAPSVTAVNNGLGLKVNKTGDRMTGNLVFDYSPSNTSNIVLYNTADQVTNTEFAQLGWLSNVFRVGTIAPTGTGSVQPVHLIRGGAPYIRLQTVSQTGAINIGGINTGADTGSVVCINPTHSSTGNVINSWSVYNNINQSSTAGYRGLFVSTYEQSLGSGIRELANFGTNTASNGTGTHTPVLRVFANGSSIFLGEVAVPNGTQNASAVNLGQLNSKVSIAGVKNITATTTITLADFGTNGTCLVYANATSGAVTINYPSAASSLGYVMYVEKTDSSANSVVIDAFGSELINQAATYPLTGQNHNIKIASDGTQLRVHN